MMIEIKARFVPLTITYTIVCLFLLFYSFLGGQKQSAGYNFTNVMSIFNIVVRL